MVVSTMREMLRVGEKRVEGGARGEDTAGRWERWKRRRIILPFMLGGWLIEKFSAERLYSLVASAALSACFPACTVVHDYERLWFCGFRLDRRAHRYLH